VCVCEFVCVFVFVFMCVCVSLGISGSVWMMVLNIPLLVVLTG